MRLYIPRSASARACIAQRPRTYTQPTQPTSCWSTACTHTTRPPRGQASPVFFLLRSASCASGSNSWLDLTSAGLLWWKTGSEFYMLITEHSYRGQCQWARGLLKWRFLKKSVLEIAENFRMSLKCPNHACIDTKLVIFAMVVSYDTIRGQKTLQKTSVVKRHFALSSRFWSPRGPKVMPRSPQ